MNKLLFKYFSKQLFFITFIFCFSGYVSLASVYTANDATSLNTAYTSAATGDTINFTGNIVVSSSLTVSKAIVINGQGYSLSVPIVGMSDAGVVNSSASAFRPLTISGSITVTINNLKIQGGGNVQGAAIYIPSGNTVKFNNCIISNSVGTSTFNGGGGIYNNGTCYLYKTAVTRNAAQYGGGFQNELGGTMFIEYSTFTENRSLSSGGAGGAGENKGGSLYVNNSSFCNNQSTSGGGALNNYLSAVAYIANTTFSGNVSVNTSLIGGAIINISSTANLVNCLFAYNYAATTVPPTTLNLDDIYAYSGTINMYYCTYMANNIGSGTINYVTGNTSRPLAADGSTNDIFTGGVYSTMYGTDGKAYGTAQYFQPYLIKVNGIAVPTLKTSSWALGKGTNIRFTNGAGTPALGYYNGSSWTDILGTTTAAYAISDDETNTTRASTPAVGSLEKIVDNYVSLKVFASSDGSVNNGSIFGDLYPNGTSVTITAIPNSGFKFSNFTYSLGGSGVLTSNPLTLTLTTNTIFTPNFTSTTDFTVTYLDNGSTGGSLPSPSDSSYASGATATIVGNTGGLTKAGFTFGGWNTQPNGSGTTYNAGDTYSSTSATNLTLYALWNSTGVPLPVRLLNFDVSAVHAKSVLIDWATGSEVNNNFFLIEKTKDAQTWESVAQVSGHGNSNQGFSYSYMDEYPYSGTSFYRLKQVDYNGNSSFSPVRSVNITALPSPMQVFPNPSSETFNIISPAFDINEVAIFDITGRNVTGHCRLTYIDEHHFNIKLSGLSDGAYWVKVNNETVQLSLQ